MPANGQFLAYAIHGKTGRACQAFVEAKKTKPGH